MTRLDFVCDRCGGEKNKIIDMRELDGAESDETWARILRADGHNMVCMTCADNIDITLLLVDLHDKIDMILKHFINFIVDKLIPEYLNPNR